MNKLLLAMTFIAFYASPIYCKVRIKHYLENYEYITFHQQREIYEQQIESLRQQYEQQIQYLRQQRDDRNREIGTLRQEIRQLERR